MSPATIPRKLKTRKRHAKGYIHTYIGDGAGKTTSALGIGLRALGNGKNVVMIQFMKGRKEIGEYQIQRLLPKYKVYQFGKVGWVSYRHPAEADKQRAKKGLAFAKKILQSRKPAHILILDEINLACGLRLLDTAEVLEMLKHAQAATDVYLTGRGAPSELLAISDFVTEIKQLKRPKRLQARKGIEY
ncbi:cob(I)yrinic acid a,c-diamide adenosyltransferase [Candidatus Woesearchaeota archaeon]|nr:cob(I)yrinic acid a,c-diamide adenosyltransferase [Candidatus Woesearchaeota archaeon]